MSSCYVFGGILIIVSATKNPEVPGRSYQEHFLPGTVNIFLVYPTGNKCSWQTLPGKPMFLVASWENIVPGRVYQEFQRSWQTLPRNIFPQWATRKIYPGRVYQEYYVPGRPYQERLLPGTHIYNKVCIWQFNIMFNLL